MLNNKKQLILISLFSLGVFLLLVLSFKIVWEKPRVERMTPEDKTQNVSLFTDISLTFQSEVNEKDRSKINFILSPQVTTKNTWQDKKTLVIKTYPYLSEDTRYQFSLYYKDSLIKTGTFKTSSPINLSDEDQQKQQTIDDYQYAKALEDERKEKPWLDALPLEDDRFVAVYDYETQKVRVNIIQDLEKDILERLKSEIKEKLKTAGIPDSLPIEWIMGE